MPIRARAATADQQRELAITSGYLSPLIAYQALTMHHPPKSFALIAPSGGGKSSLIKALLQRHFEHIALSVSHTTRSPRAGEQHGEHYYFCSQDEFQHHLEQQHFVEWAQVHHHSYGTTFAEILRIHSLGKSVVLDVDIQGWHQLKTRLSPVESVFILPPSFAEMQRRLVARASESPEHLTRRYESSLTELAQITSCSHCMMNDEFAQALGQLERWIIHGSANFAEASRCQQVSRQMMADISAYLATTRNGGSATSHGDAHGTGKDPSRTHHEHDHRRRKMKGQ